MADQILQTVPGRSSPPLTATDLLTDPDLQNLLFYYDSDLSSRPSGVIFLEVRLSSALSPFSCYYNDWQGCYCERLVTPDNGKHALGGEEKVVD